MRDGVGMHSDLSWLPNSLSCFVNVPSHTIEADVELPIGLREERYAVCRVDGNSREVWQRNVA